MRRFDPFPQSPGGESLPVRSTSPPIGVRQVVTYLSMNPAVAIALAVLLAGSIGFNLGQRSATQMIAGFFQPQRAAVNPDSIHVTGDLYLIDSVKVASPERFEYRVREMSIFFRIEPEWIMAVMFSESRLDPTARNLRGSGATGLIQFMPQTAASMGYTCNQIAAMNGVDQLELVESYLSDRMNERGDVHTLTDLYLCILYPVAVNKPDSYNLYCSPSVSYRQNSGLDENKDGCVTKSDITARMHRLFPEAARIVHKPA